MALRTITGCVAPRTRMGWEAYSMAKAYIQTCTSDLHSTLPSAEISEGADGIPG